MGVNDRERNKKDDRAKEREQAKKRRERFTGNGNGADWSEADGELLRKAVAAIAKNDGAVRLGYSRDGGAYSVGIYGDGDPFTEYVPCTEDINTYLRELIEDYAQ